MAETKGKGLSEAVLLIGKEVLRGTALVEDMETAVIRATAKKIVGMINQIIKEGREIKLAEVVSGKPVVDVRFYTEGDVIIHKVEHGSVHLGDSFILKREVALLLAKFLRAVEPDIKPGTTSHDLMKQLEIIHGVCPEMLELLLETIQEAEDKG
jgi:hypothetical protein